MLDVYWLEQTEADVPAGDDWLDSREALQQCSLRFKKRRADWRLGRWTAKNAVAACLNISPDAATLRSIGIQAAPDGAPEVVLAGLSGAVTLSLSHRAGSAICAVSKSIVTLGCDLELIEPRSDAFVADFFTLEEQALMAQASEADRSRLATLLWSAKESALKGLRAGLRLDTRCLTVSLVEGSLAYAPPTWFRMQVRQNARTLHGWWQCSGNFLRTFVADPPPARPIGM